MRALWPFDVILTFVLISSRSWNHGWHFDEASVTTTLMIQESDEGGIFEFIPDAKEWEPSEVIEVREFKG